MAALALAALGGCGSLEPYETTGGAAVRLDGTESSLHTLTIAEALARPRRTPVLLRGHPIIPHDEVSRLCTRLRRNGLCEGPSLVLANRHDDLRKLAAAVLEHGCCATGSCAPRPVAVRVRLRPGRRATLVG